jgi:hypothetical protein
VTSDRRHAWVDWLSWVEYCYNTSFHMALRATPFEVVYGRPPPSCYRMSRDPPRRRWWIHCCPAGTRSSRRSANNCCRLSRSPRSTTMPTIVMRSSKWATGCGCACSTEPHDPSTPALRGSLGRAMLVRSRSPNGSARWPIVYSFRQGHGSTTSSTWDSSNVTTVCHRRPRDPYLRCWTTGFFPRQASRSRLNNGAASGTFLFNGKGCPGGGDMGVLDGVPATVPRLPARGRAVCAGRERCHDWHGLPPTQAQEWLGRGPTGRIRGA